MSTRSRSLLPPFALAAAGVVAALTFLVTEVAAAESGKKGRGTGLTAPDPSPSAGERAVRIAVEAVGIPYRWGGESPSSGFDCSGLVRWAYGRVGIDLPHSSYALYSEGWRVPETRMEPGDLLFFEGLGHVGLYLGHGRMVHAPQSGRNVEVVRLGDLGYGGRLIGARRVAQPRQAA